MARLRDKFPPFPQSGAIANRSRTAGVVLALCIVVAHLLLCVVLPPLGTQSGFLLAFYSTGLAQGERALNFQYLQYAVMALTLLAVLHEVRAAFRDRSFPSEFAENFLQNGSSLQVARAYVGLAFVSVLAFMLAFSETGHSTRYDAIANSHLGAAMFVSGTAYIAFLALCHFGWMAVYLVHPHRKKPVG